MEQVAVAAPGNAPAVPPRELCFYEVSSFTIEERRLPRRDLMEVAAVRLARHKAEELIDKHVPALRESPVAWTLKSHTSGYNKNVTINLSVKYRLPALDANYNWRAPQGAAIFCHEDVNLLPYDVCCIIDNYCYLYNATMRLKFTRRHYEGDNYDNIVVCVAINADPVFSDERRRWTIGRKYHRPIEFDRPSIIYRNGMVKYMHRGECHRIGGMPAAILPDGHMCFGHRGKEIVQVRCDAAGKVELAIFLGGWMPDNASLLKRYYPEEIRPTLAEFAKIIKMFMVCDNCAGEHVLKRKRDTSSVEEGGNKLARLDAPSGSE